MTDDLLEISVVPAESATTIALRGELDLSNAAQVERAFDALPAGTRTILDMSGVTFVDSSGLSAIGRYARRSSAWGGLTVVVPKASMRRLFDVTGFAQIMDVVEELA